MNFHQWHGNTLTLHCHVQPKAKHNEFAGIFNERLKIRITAPPLEGKANRHLIKWIAKQFAVPQRSVTLLKEESSRQKSIAIIKPSLIPDSLAGILSHPTNKPTDK